MGWERECGWWLGGVGTGKDVGGVGCSGTDKDGIL